MSPSIRLHVLVAVSWLLFMLQVARPAMGASCSPSNLAGFDCSVQLQGASFVLHWSRPASSSTISFAAQAATSGWVAVGFSPDGFMVSSEAVIGNTPGGAVKPYQLEDYLVSAVLPSTSFSISNASSSTVNGLTTIRFTRSFSDGSFPLSSSPQIIWAYSFDNTQTLADHLSNKGSSVVDYTSFTSTSPTSKPSPAPSGATINSPPPSSPSPSPSPSTTPSSLPPAPAAVNSSSNSSNNGTSTAPTTNSSSSNSSSGCTASNLQGFSCSLQLSGQDFVLHWSRPSASQISFAFQAATSGWASVGFSSNGRMSPSDAVIGNLAGGAVGTYHITGNDRSSVQPTTNFAVTNATSTTANGVTTIMFTRSYSDGSIPVSSSGSNHIIWAYSPSNSQTLDNHQGNRGAAIIDFSGASPSSSSSSTSSSKTELAVHGFLSCLAFALLMPLGILAMYASKAASARAEAEAAADTVSSTDSLPSKLKDVEKGMSHPPASPAALAWFKAHMFLQFLATALVVAGAVFAFLASSTRGLKCTHGQVGIAVFVALVVQILLGLFRPHKTAPVRPYWAGIHWLVGVSVVGLGWANVLWGLDRFHELFGSSVRACYFAFAAACILFSLIYFFLLVKRLLVSLNPKYSGLRTSGSCANLAPLSFDSAAGEPPSAAGHRV